ncbi:MAG: hypothetical protein WA496_02885, partial [Candidatus Udaeobacter sp.]
EQSQDGFPGLSVWSRRYLADVREQEEAEAGAGAGHLRCCLAEDVREQEEAEAGAGAGHLRCCLADVQAGTFSFWVFPRRVQHTRVQRYKSKHTMSS